MCPAETIDGVSYGPRVYKETVALTHTGRFIRQLCSGDTIDIVANCWKHFGEYFRLLHDFALLGRSQRLLLSACSIDVLLVDMYLGKNSPLYGPGKVFEPATTRSRPPMGNKTFTPDFSRLVAIAALMVRRLHNDESDVSDNSNNRSGHI